MIVSPRFIWIHIPRTGGTWLREVLKRCVTQPHLGRTTDLRHHSIREVLPEERHVPILWVLRNPWDWHVSQFSWWHMHWTRQSGVFSVPESRWEESTARWADLLRSADTFEAALPSILEQRSLTLTLEELATDEEGALVGEPCRFEDLRLEVYQFMKKALGKDLSCRLKRQIATHGPDNGSPHGPYREHYTPETVAMVAEAEQSVIERFGYEF